MTIQRPPQTALHLFRSLLRECTYLPDPAARLYVHSYVLNRFREYCPRKQYKQVKSATDTRRTGILRQARKGLGLLLRANTGEIDALTKVLAHTYGRIGKRRHELLTLARAPSMLQSDQDVTVLAAASFEALGRKEFLDPKMRALMKAHMSRKDSTLWRAPIRRLEPKVPKTNTWGRSMPLKRKANIEKRWYADVLDKISPPLPVEDWRRLRDLTFGELEWSGPILRRGNSLQTLGFSNIQNPHRLTARYMRRLWGKVFSQCSIMTWDNVKSQWKVQWGSINRPRPFSVLKNEDDKHLMLFRGVNEIGKAFQ